MPQICHPAAAGARLVFAELQACEIFPLKHTRIDAFCADIVKNESWKENRLLHRLQDS